MIKKSYDKNDENLDVKTEENFDDEIGVNPVKTRRRESC